MLWCKNFLFYFLLSLCHFLHLSGFMTTFSLFRLQIYNFTLNSTKNCFKKYYPIFNIAIENFPVDYSKLKIIN